MLPGCQVNKGGTRKVQTGAKKVRNVHFAKLGRCEISVIAHPFGIVDAP